jgi:hypothetical protein
MTGKRTDILSTSAASKLALKACVSAAQYPQAPQWQKVSLKNLSLCCGWSVSR